MLTDPEIRNARPRERPYKLHDGRGLFLLIHPNGSRYWRMKFMRAGKEHVLSFGVYPRVSAAQARREADKARGELADGVNPAIERKKAKLRALSGMAGDTFAEVAEEWMGVKDARASENYKRDYQSAVRTHLIPKLGAFRVHEIDAPMLLGALRAVERRGALELTRRCRMWARQILDYAIATGRRSGENPARALTADVLRSPTSTRRPALTVDEAPTFLRRLVDYPGRVETRLAVELLLLTALRSAEVREGRWEEIDLVASVWRIPAVRMKARGEHVVPLSRQAVAALEDLRVLTGHSKLLLPGASRKRHMSDGTLAKAFRMLLPERHVVPHGCRAFFSTHANDSGLWRHDVIEAALAHKQSGVRGAYNRGDYLAERRRLMQWWADELDALRARR